MDRGRFFSVPPLEEIKKAKSVSHEEGPTLFKSARGKEASTVDKEPTGAGDGPDVKQVGSGGTEGGGAIVHRKASSKHSVVTHTRGSSNPQTLAGTQTSTANSSMAVFSRSGSLKAGGPPQQQDNQAETTGTGASLTGGSRAGAGGLTGGSRAGAGGLTGGSRTGAGGLTGGSRAGAGGLTGGSRESDSTVSTAGESSSSLSAPTVAPTGSHHHPHAILTNPVQVRGLILLNFGI